MATGARQEYQDLVLKYSQQFGVPYDLALAVLETESNYRPDAVSKKKAKGLFQIMPVIIKRYGVTDPFDPEQNVRAGVEHLGVLLRKYEDPTMAIAAYNAGEPAVDRASGIPDFPETQQYVQRVNAARRRLSQAREGSETVAQDSQFSEQWIYPTLGQQPSPPQPFQEMIDGDGVPLPDNHPDREGILVSWEGAEDEGPTDEEVQKIYQEVDPQGVITREDAASIAAMGASVVPGVGRFIANRARDVGRLIGSNPAARAAVTAGRFVPGVGLAMPLGIAAAGGIGEAYRQSQVPKTVGRFDVESWPRSRFGWHYEGAPDTPWESAASIAVMAIQEGLGEGIGGVLVAGIRRGAQFLKGTGFPKLQRQAINRAMPGGNVSSAIRGPEGVTRTVAETGTSPTNASVVRAQEAGDAAVTASDAILKEAESATGPINISTEKVVNDAYEYLQGSVSRLDIQNSISWPQLPKAAEDILEGVKKHWTVPAETLIIPAQRRSGVGFGPGPIGAARPERIETISPAFVRKIPVVEANLMRREANVAAAPISSAAKRAGQTVDAIGPKVQSALARSLRENIHSALNAAERSASGSKLQRGLKRIKNLGRPGYTRRFGDRWRNQVDNSSQWYTARNIAEFGADQPMSGLLGGALAFSAPAVVGSMIGAPAVGAAAGLGAMSLLYPPMRSLVGGGLYKAGGALGMTPVQALRAGTIRGGFQPKPYQQSPLVNFESFGFTPPQLNMENFRFVPPEEDVLQPWEGQPGPSSNLGTGVRRRRRDRRAP